MKTTGQCPKCSSTDLIIDAFVRDQGLHSNQRLQLITFKDPDAAFDKEPVINSLKATVCTACGYTELYASNPSALREALLTSRANEKNATFRNEPIYPRPLNHPGRSSLLAPSTPAYSPPVYKVHEVHPVMKSIPKRISPFDDFSDSLATLQKTATRFRNKAWGCSCNDLPQENTLRISKTPTVSQSHSDVGMPTTGRPSTRSVAWESIHS